MEGKFKNGGGPANLAMPATLDGLRLKGHFDQDARFSFIDEELARVLGHRVQSLYGSSFLNFVHPGDQLAANGFLALLKHNFKEQFVSLRFKASDGQWLSIEIVGKNQLFNPRVNGYVFNITGITENSLQEDATCGEGPGFKSLFDKNPDVFYYESRDGIIRDVSKNAEKFGYTREQLIGQYGPGLLSSDMALVYNKAFQDVLKGKSSSFEFELSSPGNKVYVFDAKKVPLEIDGEVVGIFTIARDMTEIRDITGNGQELLGQNHIFANIEEAFFILDNNWNLCYINHEFDRLLGTNRIVNTGRNIWELFPEEYGGDLYDQLNKAFESGKPIHFEALLKRSGNWIEIKAIPSAKGLSVYFTDITERVKSENELKKLAAVASKTQNGVLILDKDWSIEWMNDAFSNISGLGKEDIVGMNILGIFDIPEEDIQRLRSGKPVKVECEFARPAVPPVWLHLDISPEASSHAGPSCLLVLVTDITFQRQEALNKNRFIKELEDQNNSLQQFSHIVSHNLRAPVNNILGLTEMFALPEEDPDTREEIIKNLRQAAQNLNTIITDLNQILSNRGSIDNISEWVPMEKSYAEVLELLRPQIEQAGAKIHHKFEVESVKTIKSYLDSIFFNLISNALKFKAPSRNLELEIASYREGKYTVLRVRDNGIGIDMEKHGKSVFGLYKRFHAHLQGRGIGLFLVKTQIESQGGKVEVESQVDVGTAFKVYFPM